MKEILIVEDNDIDFAQAKERLEEAGEPIAITRAKSLKEAEGFAKQKKFDLIFLDPGLPDVTDRKYEAYGRLCRYIDAEHIKIVTGDVDAGMVDAIGRRGSEVISKDDAYRGDALLTSTFGVEFILDRMATKSSTRRLIEVLLTREIVPFKADIELQLGRVRLDLENIKRVANQSGRIGQELLGEMNMVKLKQEALTRSLDQFSQSLTKLTKTVSENESARLEFAKLRWQTIGALLTAVLTLVGGIITTIIAKHTVDEAKETKESPAVVSPSPKKSE